MILVVYPFSFCVYVNMITVDIAVAVDQSEHILNVCSASC